MEQEIIFYNPETYLETQSGNKISKKNLIKGLDQIQPAGKVIMQDKSIIRGDLGTIKIGKYVILQENVTLRPTYKKLKGNLKFMPMYIGEYVIIEQNSIICASKIGSYVQIGRNCILSHRCIINDNVKILDDSILPPDSIIPPFTVYGGKPACFIGEMPESTPIIMKQMAINYYNSFVARIPVASDKPKDKVPEKAQN